MTKNFLLIGLLTFSVIAGGFWYVQTQKETDIPNAVQETNTAQEINIDQEETKIDKIEEVVQNDRTSAVILEKSNQIREERIKSELTPADWKTFTNIKFAFAVDAPSGWKANEEFAGLGSEGIRVWLPLPKSEEFAVSFSLLYFNGKNLSILQGNEDLIAKYGEALKYFREVDSWQTAEGDDLIKFYAKNSDKPFALENYIFVANESKEKGEPLSTQEIETIKKIVKSFRKL